MNYRQKTLIGLLSAFGGHLPSTDFQKYLFLFTRQQGIVMAFADVFLLLGLLFLVFAPLVWFMRRPPPVTGPAPDAH